MRSTCETLEYQSQTEFTHSIFHRNSEIRKSTHFDSNTIAPLNHTSTTFKIIFHFMDLYAHWIHSTANVQQKVCFRNLNICFSFCWQIKTEFQHWLKLLFSFVVSTTRTLNCIQTKSVWYFIHCYFHCSWISTYIVYWHTYIVCLALNCGFLIFLIGFYYNMLCCACVCSDFNGYSYIHVETIAYILLCSPALLQRIQWKQMPVLFNVFQLQIGAYESLISFTSHTFRFKRQTAVKHKS